MDGLAENLKRLRRRSGCTQAELAARSGIPRATLASLEQPGANPAVRTVLMVARALGVGLDELLVPPPASRVVLVGPRQAQDFRADAGRFLARLVSPITSKGVQVHRMSLRPGCDATGRPHPHGAQEFFVSVSGSARVTVEDESWEVPDGCLLQFPGHLRHSYANPGSQAVEAVAVVVLRLD
jgi:transcriptional regulator with XRE-family HTH domain